MKRKLIFLVVEDWYFHSHRLPMAQAAMKAGFDVAVITRPGPLVPAIEAAGIRVIPFAMDRTGLRPSRALQDLAGLIRIYRREKPDAVHHIAMKPVLFGAMAAALTRVPCVINAFAGLGYLFTSDAAKARFLRMEILPAFRLLLKRKGSVVLLQNKDDKALLDSLHLLPQGRTLVIRGSGVDLEVYPALPLPQQSEPFICAFAGRMIDIKGLKTLQQCFVLLQQTHPQIRLWLCGTPDPANPGSWTEKSLRAWERDAGNVVYKGSCDMRDVWKHAHLAVQPSWGGEGVPKSLLEAAASGRAIVATDVPGCREVVRPEVNGLLVPPKDAQALAAAIARIASNPALNAAFASHSREVVANGLSAADVRAQAEAMYRECLQALGGCG